MGPGPWHMSRQEPIVDSSPSRRTLEMTPRMPIQSDPPVYSSRTHFKISGLSGVEWSAVVLALFLHASMDFDAKLTHPIPVKTVACPPCQSQMYAAIDGARITGNLC